MPDDFTPDDRLLYTEIAFAQHVRGTLKWHEGKTYAMARVERTVKRMTFAIVVKRDEPRTPGLLPAIRVYSHDEVVKMMDRMEDGPLRSEFFQLLVKVLD